MAGGRGGDVVVPEPLRIEQSWCETCKEWSVIDAGRPCAFCDTILVKRRGGWKKKPRYRINEKMARALHAKYVQGFSARRLGIELHGVLGYKSHHSADVAIGRAFRRFGLPVRERIEATVLASTSSGLSPQDRAERTRKRRAAGLVASGRRAMQPRQPLCAGTRAYYPRKGERCSRWARIGSEFCTAHDPALKAERDRHMAEMRARLAA